MPFHSQLLFNVSLRWELGSQKNHEILHENPKIFFAGRCPAPRRGSAPDPSWGFAPDPNLSLHSHWGTMT